MVNVLGYDIVVSKFELQSRYYIHLQTNTPLAAVILLLFLARKGVNVRVFIYVELFPR